jgi:hypothetical protein
MTLADELRKLEELHRSGALTDEEFAQAKAAVLNSAPPAEDPVVQDTNLLLVDPGEVLTPQRLRIMQIIAGMLLMGVVVFLAIVLFIVFVQHNGQGTAPAKALPVVSLVAGAMFAVCAPLAFIVPGIMTGSALRQIVSGTWPIPPGGNPSEFATAGRKLLAVRQTTMLVGLALLNGTAFLGCIAYLLEAQALALGVVAVTVVLMLCKFPTEGRVRAWLDRQGEALAALRQQ